MPGCLRARFTKSSAGKSGAWAGRRIRYGGRDSRLGCPLFSLVSQVVLTPLVRDLGYSVGFLIVVLIVQQGVKFTAMPSWPNSTRDDEVWSMVAFLRLLPKMDAKTYLAMTAFAEAPETTPTIPTGDNVKLRPSDTERAAPPQDEFLYAAPAVGFGDRILRTHPIALCAGCHGKEGDGSGTILDAICARRSMPIRLAPERAALRPVA
jgi:hypothetical protein